MRKIQAAWVGNVITGSSYNFRRAIENGNTEIEDHSNLTMSMSLRAAAMGVPFMPARTALGSDLFKSNARLKTITCPFTGDTLTAVAAIRPDVTIIHTQRADEQGNAHMWGNMGITREACLAGEYVIIIAEEIVPTDTIRSDPNRGSSSLGFGSVLWCMHRGADIRLRCRGVITGITNHLLTTEPRVEHRKVLPIGRHFG